MSESSTRSYSSDNDISRIERGLEKINDKLDGLVGGFSDFKITAAAHMAKTDSLDSKLVLLEKDFHAHREKTEDTVTDLSIRLGNLYTKIAPIFIIGAMVLSVAINRFITMLTPTH